MESELVQGPSAENTQTWSSGYTFILAAVGAAVGLGNIWKFPYVVGVSGGGAFVLVYIVCVVLVAIPILICELWVGRRGHHSPPIAMRTVAKAAGRSGKWSLIGWMGLVVGYLIATYYSVVAGWTIAYIFKAANGFGGADVASVSQQFDALLADPVTMILWHTIFIVLALLIVGQGLRGGIERAVKLLMPGLFLMLFAMICYAAVAGDFKAATDFLFSADFNKINGSTVLVAIGQAFFSIGVSMGLMMAYGAYVPKSVSLTKSALIIAGVDTIVALLAGLMIFPLVFANGLDPASGPGLIFRTLPIAFAEMSGGALFGAMFFLLLAFAAITSIIAIIEPIIAYAEDKWGMRRRNGCFLFGFIAWLIGLATVFSFNVLSELRPLGAISTFADMNIYALIDYFTASLLMPLGGLLIAVFVGWRINPTLLAEELSFGSAVLFKIWLLTIRVVAPLAILGVLYTTL